MKEGEQKLEFLLTLAFLALVEPTYFLAPSQTYQFAGRCYHLVAD